MKYKEHNNELHIELLAHSGNTALDNVVYTVSVYDSNEVTLNELERVYCMERPIRKCFIRRVRMLS